MILGLNNAKSVRRSIQRRRISNGSVVLISPYTMRKMIYGGAVVRKERISLAARLAHMRVRRMKTKMMLKKTRTKIR